MFNNGNALACANIYEITCQALLNYDELSIEIKKISQMPLSKAKRPISERSGMGIEICNGSNLRRNPNNKLKGQTFQNRNPFSRF